MKRYRKHRKMIVYLYCRNVLFRRSARQDKTAVTTGAVQRADPTATPACSCTICRLYRITIWAWLPPILRAEWETVSFSSSITVFLIFVIITEREQIYHLLSFLWINAKSTSYSPAEKGTWTLMSFTSHGPEPCASANSAISAYVGRGNHAVVGPCRTTLF